MTQDNKPTESKEEKKKPQDNTGVMMTGHIKIFDPETGEVIVDKRNAIHYENMCQSLANSSYTTHQLTATQAIAVLHQLTRSGLPEKQLSTMSRGDSRPLFSNGDPNGQARNRRVEIVIYPETYESS